MRSHHSFFNDGPFIRMDIDGADIGIAPAAAAYSPCCPSRSLLHPGLGQSADPLYINGPAKRCACPFRQPEADPLWCSEIPLNFAAQPRCLRRRPRRWRPGPGPIVGDRSRF